MYNKPKGEQKLTENEVLEGLKEMTGVDPMTDLEAEPEQLVVQQEEEKPNVEAEPEEPEGEAAAVEETPPEEEPATSDETGEVEPKEGEELEATPSAFDQQIEEIRQENRRLREQMDTMFLKDSGSSAISSGISGATPQPEQTSVAPQPVQPQPVPVTSQTRDITGAFDQNTHAKMMEDPAHFAQMMQAVYSQAMIDSREMIMREVPGLVSPVVDGKLEVQQQVMHLFMRHPVLSEHRDQVAVLARVVEARNPGMDVGKVFGLLEEELTKNYSGWMNLPDNNSKPVKESSVVKKSVRKPAVVGGPRKRSSVDAKAKLTEMQADMVAMGKAGQYADDK